MSRSVPYDLDRPDVPPAEEIVALASRAAAADGAEDGSTHDGSGADAAEGE